MNARDKLAAVAWAAGRAGVSYGRFTRGLSERAVEQICREYADWRAQRDRGLVATARERNEEAKKIRRKGKRIPCAMRFEDA